MKSIEKFEELHAQCTAQSAIGAKGTVPSQQGNKAHIKQERLRRVRLSRLKQIDSREYRKIRFNGEIKLIEKGVSDG
jgi:hypothetical protein